MWKWSGVTARPGAGASVKSNRQWSVSGWSVPVTREENNVHCGRCNLQRRWHCLKEKILEREKQRWSSVADIGAKELPELSQRVLLAAKLPPSVFLLCGRTQGLFFLPLPWSPSSFLRDVLPEFFVLLGHGPPPAVIFKWCKSSHYASNHPSIFLLFHVLERKTQPFTALVLAYSSGLPEVPPRWPLSSPQVCVSKSKKPADLDLMCTRKMTSPPLVFGTFQNDCSQGWSLSRCSFSAKGCCSPSGEITAQIKKRCCFGSNTRFSQSETALQGHVLSNKAEISRNLPLYEL